MHWVALLGGVAAGASGACGNRSDDPKGAPEAPENIEAPSPVKESLAAIVASAAQVQGEVQIRRRGQDDWEPAAVGAALRTGDTVRTGERSFAQVRFSRGGTLELEESTSVVIELTPEGEGGGEGVVVAVEEGAVGASIDKSGVDSQPLYVDTGDGSRAAVHPDPESDEPTEFRVRKSKDQTTEIAVRKGRLRVKAGGKETEIGAGSAADVTSSGVGDVISLIAFPVSVNPGIDARYRFQDGLRVVLEWKPVDDASGYRLQIARDLSFHDLVITAETQKPRFSFAPEQAGMYAWRVASRDDERRPGEFGFARRLFCEIDPPEDLLVSPADGERHAYTHNKPELTFSWQTAGGATSYRVAVSRGKDPLGNPVVDQLTQEQSLTVDSLGEGRYTWGVYAVGEVSKPLFLRPRKLIIDHRKAPEADTKDIWD